MGNDKGRSFCFPAVVPALREGEPGPDVEQELPGLGRYLRGPGPGHRHPGPPPAPCDDRQYQGGVVPAQGKTEGGAPGVQGASSRGTGSP